MLSSHNKGFIEYKALNYFAHLAFKKSHVFSFMFPNMELHDFDDFCYMEMHMCVFIHYHIELYKEDGNGLVLLKYAQLLSDGTLHCVIVSHHC